MKEGVGGARTSFAASVRALGASLIFPEGPTGSGHRLASGHMTRLNELVRTFGKLEDMFLAAHFDSMVKLMGSGGIEFNLVSVLNELGIRVQCSGGMINVRSWRDIPS